MKKVGSAAVFVKKKAISFADKIKETCSPSKVRKLLQVKGRKFFQELLDFKPKSDSDYYRIGSFMIGKKLVLAAAIFAGIFSMAYLFMIRPEDTGESGGLYRSYRYDSPALRFLKGRAVILGKSGYRAYVGDVEYGMVKGEGRLYDREGNLVYQGEFDENSYNGTGKSYYRGGEICYEGEFQDNLYQGKGRLYRENGGLWFEGEFEMGYREGEGVLYNPGGEAVYTGHFRRDEVLYQEFLGKTTREGAQMYTGNREIFEAGDRYLCSMTDIGAVYMGGEESNVAEEDFLISGIYVLKDSLWLKGREAAEISELTEYFGQPIYQGYTYLSGEDAIALDQASLFREDVLFGPAGISVEKIFDDVSVLQSYEKNYEVYIYVFEKEDVTYTFFSRDKNQGFGFYFMELTQ